MVPSSVCVHTFFCESSFLCKTLWSAAIAQHQFYLDQRTKANSKVGCILTLTLIASPATRALDKQIQYYLYTFIQHTIANY